MAVQFSFLRYPGGKGGMFKKHLLPLLPEIIDEYREPFVGGGGVAFEISRLFPSASIWINDLYPPLVAAYQAVQDPDKCREMVDWLLAVHRDTPTEVLANKAFQKANAVMHDENESTVMRGAAFWLHNRLTYSGAQSAKTITDENYARWRLRGEHHIHKLAMFTPRMKGWKITCGDYEEVMSAPISGRAPLVFCDPPYDIKSATLYGRQGDHHDGFEHQRFVDVAEKVHSACVVTYNEELYDRFPLWPFRQRVEHAYSMQSNKTYRKAQKTRKELVVANYSTTAKKLEQSSTFKAPKAGICPNAFRETLKRLGLTQRAAAEYLEVTTRTITFWLAGERTIPKRTMLALAAMAPKASGPKKRPGATL